MNTPKPILLNPHQQEAVSTIEGAVLVVAGAGSGKTRVITTRMAQLIQDGVPPQSIVALTFTNKAANEMKERLKKSLGTAHLLPFVGTFHSYCLLLLRRYPYIAPFEPFSIMDSDDQEALLKRLLKGHGLDKQISSTQLLHTISQFKNKQESADEFFVQPVLKELYAAYEKEKKNAHLCDFDDLLVHVLNALEKNPTFKAQMQMNIRHILVDEYQDTNHTQHSLLKALALNNENKLGIDSICAVGDEDQSIYSWRGALVTNMQSFARDFAPCKIVKIEQNYRSAEPILQAANEMISNNKDRISKVLWSDRKARERIVLVSCQTAYQEGDVITALIRDLPATTKRSSVAVLYRAHYQSRILEEALIHSGIAYQLVGGIRFYERKEIKDILAYLRLLVNPHDKASLLRIINTPARGLGAKFEEQLIEMWNNEPFLTFTELCLKLIKDGVVTGIKAAAVKDFVEVFGDVEKNSPSKAVQDILENTGYINYLRNEYDEEEAQTKVDNVREFTHSVAYYEKSRGLESTFSLEDFLHEIALVQEKIEEPSGTEAITMMTLHAAKGLEFDVVIIMGIEEGILPSSRSLNTQKSLEEERRLLYVGITRAKERLVLTHARSRASFGQVNDQESSRFLDEIPQRLLTHFDLNRVHQSFVRQNLKDWAHGQPVGFVAAAKKPASSEHSAATKQSMAKSNFFNARPVTAPKTLNSSAQTAAPLIDTGEWKKHQPVLHPVFGAGVIKAIERKDDQEFYLTVLFKVGEKKIASGFVKKI